MLLIGQPVVDILRPSGERVLRPSVPPADAEEQVPEDSAEHDVEGENAQDDQAQEHGLSGELKVGKVYKGENEVTKLNWPTNIHVKPDVENARYLDLLRIRLKFERSKKKKKGAK